MGIDVYMRWPGMSFEQQEAQIHGFTVSKAAGATGYLREAYHGDPYATKVLLPPEAWEHENYVLLPDTVSRYEAQYGDEEKITGYKISAQELRAQLPAAIEAAHERGRTVYDDPDGNKDQEEALTAFVELAENLQRGDKQPYVYISY